MNKEEFAAFLDENLNSQTVFFKKSMNYSLNYGSQGMVWIVEKGSLVTLQTEGDGREIGTGIYGPNMLLGIRSFYDAANNIVICKPIQDTVLKGYKSSEVYGLLEKNNEAALFLLKFACSRFTFVMNTLRINGLSRVEERLEQLEELLKDFSGDETINVPVNVLAAYLGVHPSSISRVKNTKKKSVNEIQKH